MNAYVKISEIDCPCYVPKVKKIITMRGKSHETSEIDDFESLRIYTDCYYVFVGEQILHVWGKNIEFVSFQ